MDGFFYKLSKFIVFRVLQNLMLDKIYELYFGIVKCKVCVCEVFFWIGMLIDVEN